MGKINLLDCTLRDGGYINNWEFGYEGICDIIKKLEQTEIEMIELGFLKGEEYCPNKTLFPDVDSFERVLGHKKTGVEYLGMLDMSAPIPLSCIPKNSGTSIDGIRVIFKKEKMEEAYKVCEYIKLQGYKVYVNFVSTDAYSDIEFINGIDLFNSLEPDGATIVDTFGMIKKKQFQRLVAIADNNLNPDVKLCYHAHNNLQQAFGNAETIVEMNLNRDIVIDACVFGMGRGAGNLNLELFADYLNENYQKNYKITPMLEIMDEYLNEFYRSKFWGYSLPLYLSAIQGCHPNYAIYLAEKNTLSEKAFNELLRSISYDDKYVFSREKAEDYYTRYMNSYVDDSAAIEQLSNEFEGKSVLLVTPGKSIKNYQDEIRKNIDDDTIVISVNYVDPVFPPNYVFVGNIRRYGKVVNSYNGVVIATSNIPDCHEATHVVNYLSLTGPNNDVFDNSGLMALRLLETLGVKAVRVAGMDGFSEAEGNDYYDKGFEAYHTQKRYIRNNLVSEELKTINKSMKLTFITPTNYDVL